jgi:choline kinase
MVNIVFLVAGMSSRFGGNPKQFAQVGPSGETLIEYSVIQALENNFKELIFITNKKTQHLFETLFKNNYRNIPVRYIPQEYSDPRIRPWGTCDAICSMLNHSINEPFIMVNGDDIYGKETFNIGYTKMQKNVNIIGGLKIVKTLPDNGFVNRGIIEIDGTKVIGLKEMLTISKENNPELHDKLANVNFIGLQQDVLIKLNKNLQAFKDKHVNDPKIECLLTDELNDLIKSNKLELTFFEIQNTIYGITNPGDDVILKSKLTFI